MSAAVTDGAKELPTKENNLFKQVVKCYETKLYKKGLKSAEARGAASTLESTFQLNFSF